ncbi:MAG: DUF2179 domain-containing protein [Methanoregulaceae archaeon]|nr:DUF2179 domain-containing protein [Methanoregulaceae archaeon]
MPEPFISSDLFEWVILPLLIFSARICDVSMGTIRVIFISKGIKNLAPLIGFFEVIIWLLAIGQVMNNVTNVASYIAYGGGFAAGTYIGMLIEEKISLGLTSVRIITNEDPTRLVEYLRSQNYGVTAVDGEGSAGQVKIIISIIRRQDLTGVVDAITTFNPGAFYSVEDIKSVSEGVFPEERRRFPIPYSEALRFFRKGK